MVRCSTPLLATLALALAGCNPSDDGVFKGGSNEQKPGATLLAGLNVGANATDAAAVTKAASVTYIMTVKSASDATLCTGEATIDIMSNFSFQVPQAQIQCLSLSVNLAGLLASGAGGASAADAAKAISVSDDGQVLLISKVANATFSPPRPLLLGPIVQDVTKFNNYTKQVATTVSATDANGAPVSAPGTITVKVNSTGTTYSNQLDPANNFSSIMDWTMTAEGFQGIPQKDGLLFQSMEFFWNTRPIMIPKIIIKGGLSDFISAPAGTATSTGPDTAAQVVGTLTIELTVKKFSF